jgi:hypothetical protein
MLFRFIMFALIFVSCSLMLSTGAKASSTCNAKKGDNGKRNAVRKEGYAGSTFFSKISAKKDTFGKTEKTGNTGSPGKEKAVNTRKKVAGKSKMDSEAARRIQSAEAKKNGS